MTFHVLFIDKNRYEVCSEDGRYSREVRSRPLAELIAQALASGKTDADVEKIIAADSERRQRIRSANKARSDAMRDIGMRRNLDGSWE